MTPIERVQRKSQALAKLGMKGMANETEIKRAYKRMVLARHPDRGEGTHEEFLELNDAFKFLIEELEKSTANVAPALSPRRPSRPRPTEGTETRFDATMIAKCEDLQKWDERRCEARHVATSLRQSGRELTYVAPTALRKGLNTIALPAADLTRPNAFEPVLVTVRANGSGENVANLPTDMRNRLFSGARQVRIEFATS